MVITKKYDWEQKLPDLSRSNGETYFIIPEQTLIIEKNVKFSMYLSWVKHQYGSCTSVRFQVKPIEGVNIFSTVLEYSMNSPNGKIEGTISNLTYDKEKNTHYSAFDINESSKTFFSIFNGKNSKDGTSVTYSLTVELALTDVPILVEEFSKLPALLFADKELCDVKIICNGKTFDCHKLVLSCRSDVFKTMFKNDSDMAEANTGEVEIKDFDDETIKTFLHFIYNDKIVDEKLIDTRLLHISEKYNVRELFLLCRSHLEKNLSFENAIDVLVSAHLTNQKSLFDAASKFVWHNRGHLMKTESWKELKETNPKMANDVLTSMLNL